MTVAVERLDLEPALEHRTPARLQEFLETAPVRLAVALRDYGPGQALSDRLLPGPAERALRLRVPGGDQAVLVDRDEGKLGGVDDPAEMLLTRPQRLLGVLSLGYVRRDRADGVRGALRVVRVKEGEPGGEIDTWPVLVIGHLLGVERDSGREHLQVVCPVRVRLLCGKKVTVGLADCLVAADVVEHLEAVVDQQVTAVLVLQKDDGGRVVDDVLQALSALPQFPLRLLACGDVLELRDQVERLVVGISHQRDRHQRPQRMAVGVAKALLDLVLRDVVGEHPPHVVQLRFDVVGMNDRLEVGADEVRFGEARYLAERAVDPQEAPGPLAVDSNDGHTDRCLLERRLEELLDLVGRIERLLALGDVSAGREYELVVGTRLGRPEDRAVGATPLPNALTEVAHLTALRREPLGLGEGARDVVGVDEVEIRAPGQLVLRVADDPLECRVHPPQVSVEVDDAEEVR